jgi:dipeptidyl aminopeptidase/acylaminoacyl peptidase
MEKVLGGPPYGLTLRNWEAFSPALNAQRVQVPVLMESSAEEAILGLEMFGTLRYHEVPVEFVIYPDEGHVLTQPVHRLASMRRNLDWFSFWLLKKEDPDPAKREQYERWRAMRGHLARNERRERS